MNNKFIVIYIEFYNLKSDIAIYFYTTLTKIYYLSLYTLILIISVILTFLFFVCFIYCLNHLYNIGRDDVEMSPSVPL